MNTITLPVTVAGKTADVTFSNLGHAAWSDPIFTGHIGRGSKTHHVMIPAFPFATETEARHRGYRNEDIHTLEDGSVWAVKLEGHALNRTCRVTGWREDGAATSQHIMER